MIELPRFEKTTCQIFSICLPLSTAQKKMFSKSLLHKEPYIASFNALNKMAYLRIFLAGKKEYRMHIDCALQEYFPKNSGPKTNRNIAYLLKLIQLLNGCSVAADISAGFSEPFDNLPENGFIRTLSSEQKFRGGTFKIVDISIKLKDLPLYLISWSFNDDNKEFFIMIKAEIKEKIDEGIFIRTLNWLNQNYNLSIFGKA